MIERISLSLSKEENDLLRQSAKYLKMSISDYIKLRLFVKTKAKIRLRK